MAKALTIAAHSVLHPRGKVDFLRTVGSGRLLDVGCGNNSPYRFKTLFPRFHYTGIDVGNWNQTKPMLADEYIVTGPETFASKIAELRDSFDAVICSHNLEHCDDPEDTLEAMIASLRTGGLIFLSFPCEASLTFPERKGTLNYFGEPDHNPQPPSFDAVLSTLKSRGCEVMYGARRYRPLLLRCLGAIFEPLSRLLKRNFRGTWEYWGFESVIWARKR